jgi:hypothetical protein
MDTPQNHNGNGPASGRNRPLATILTLSAGLVAGLFRLVPHPPNLTAVGALGLYGGARLRSWHAFALPIGIMVFTDFALWVFTGFSPMYSPLHLSRAFVYTSFLVYVLLGRTLARTQSFGWIAAASVLGSLQFFLITNAGTWLTQPWVPTADLAGTPRWSRDLAGLLDCIAAGLPFYQGDPLFDLHRFCVGDIRYAFYYLVLGDLSFSFALFGLHAWLARRAFPAERVQLHPAAQGAVPV